MIFFNNRKFKVLLGMTLLLVLFLTVINLIIANQPAICDNVNEIHFSKESGFYDEEFDLAITSDSGTIYYTLDGSIPTKDSIQYVKPIHITDATYNENVYSMLEEVSTGFETELIKEYSSEYPGYKVPDFLVDKCNVVRAVIYYGNDKYSKVKTATFFVGFSEKDGYDNVNIVTISTDPKNLFDYNDGIYVKGKTFDEFKEYGLGNAEVWYSPFWLHWNSNYTNRGIEWEREATCQFYKDGKLLLSQDCGIRIHGGGSRGKNPKSINLNVRSEYSQYDHFMYNFFENKYYPSRMTLFQGGDDDISKCRDYLMSRFAEDLNISSMKFEPYVLFLNGEYWGVYWLTEKYDENYVNYYYKVPKDDVVIIKDAYVDVGIETDLNLYNELHDFIMNNDMNDSDNYAKLTEMLDIDSFVDYYASLYYVCRRGDWPGANRRMWRSRKIGEGDFNDGKWRFMVYDVNEYSMDINGTCYNSYEDICTNEMFAKLMTNEVIKERFVNRVLELKDTVFSMENVTKYLDDYYLVMNDGTMEKNIQRFWGNDFYTRYEDEMQSIIYFFENRGSYIESIDIVD